MATAKIVHHWPDGTIDEFHFQVDASYPDACDEAKARCLDLYRTVCIDDDEGEQ